MRVLKLLITTSLLFLGLVTSAMAAERINTLEKKGLFGYEPNGIAIRGYDTVAYFTQDKPVEGNDKFTTQWSDATWKFSSQEHLDLFIAEPEKYAPQYGGYCAYGVANESLVKIEPEQWSIVDDKLYLNYNAKLNREWKKDISGYITKADALFEKLLDTQ
ncbi:MAG: YHS domain-containing (seleno)protein [Granulosicoccus sp.]